MITLCLTVISVSFTPNSCKNKYATPLQGVFAPVHDEM